MKRVSVADIEPLVGECRGNIAEIARRLHVSRGTIHNRIDESPTLQTALDDAREAYVDAVESALYDNALGGNVAAQIFVMKAHPAAKRRGWSERQEVAGANGGALALVIEYVNDWRSVSDQSANQDATDDYADARR